MPDPSVSQSGAWIEVEHGDVQRTHPDVPRLPNGRYVPEAVIKRQRQEIAQLNEVLHRKNLELDALHMVWCDGGCKSGVHRWTEDEVTEELVAAAERNTARLRRWFTNHKFREANRA